MRSSPRLRIAAACVLSLLAALLTTAPAEASRTDCTPEVGWPQHDPNLALQVLQEVNAYRTSLGLNALGLSQSLTNAATWKAAQLAVDVPATNGAAFLHEDWGTGRTVPERLQACGYGDSAGENIALGQQSAQRVMEMWKASPGHDQNLRYAAWTAIGIGAVAGPGGIAWVQDFGVSNPDPIATPVSNLVPPAPTAPTLAVPLAAPIPPPAAVAAPAAMARPEVKIMARPKSRTHRRTARIRWSISGAAQRVTCTLNGKQLARCGATGRTLVVRRGRHVFRVTAIGPTGTDSQKISWRVLRD